MANNLDFALLYAQNDLAVFPLHNPIFEADKIRCSCRKGETCDATGKHPRTRNGSLDATTDLQHIEEWWTKHPDANIGIATGRKSGIFVLDVDAKSGGLISLDGLELEFGFLPETLIQKTGGGGKHYIFRLPTLPNGRELVIKNSNSAIADGLDIKAESGHIVAAPSLHKSGKRYELETHEGTIANASDWLLALIFDAERPIQTELDEEQITEATVLNVRKHRASGNADQIYKEALERIHRGEQVIPGMRNIYLSRQLYGLLQSRSPEQAIQIIRRKNGKHCEPLYEHLDRIERSVLKRLKEAA
jgi:putative DNA primase/helicase